MRPRRISLATAALLLVRLGEGLHRRRNWLRLSWPSLHRTIMATSGTWVSTPKSTREGGFDKAPGWLAGFKGASAGIAMRAEPRLKTPSYAQGYAPPPHQLGRPW